MKPITRRRVLELGAASSAAALAGCLGGLGGGGGGSDGDAAYADWLPAAEDQLLTAALDVTVRRRSSSIDPLLPLVLPSGEESSPAEFVPDLSGLDAVDDPLVTFPLRIGGQLIGVAGLSLAVTGLHDLVDPSRPTEGVTKLFLANGTVVGTGTIDTARAHETLRSGTASAFGDLQFEVVREGQAYTFYESSSDVGGAVAVGESAMIVGDSLSGVEGVLGAKRGDRARAVEASEIFGWLFDAAGSGDVVVGWEGPVDLGGFYWGGEPPETAPVTPRDDVLASVTFAPGSDELTADLALRGADLDDARADRLRTRLGRASDDASVSVDGDRVTASGTYTDGELGIDFVTRTPTARPTTPPSGSDLPPAVASAVPQGAFGFTYDAEQSTVRVDFRKEFEAEEVTVRALESGSVTSTSTPGVIDYLTVYVNSGGDEVVVEVTVDGASGIVARHEVP